MTGRGSGVNDTLCGMKIQKNDKWVLMGDSVTDAGRSQPVGEGLFDPQGKGYVNFILALFGAVCPERNVRIVNMGTSGNTSRDLRGRWQRDCLDLNPDWVSIMIGVNDVWRQFDMPLIKEAHIGLKEYEENLRWMAEQSLPKVKGLILATPYVLEANKKDAMRVRMDQYGAVVRKLAKEYKVLLVDTQAAFDAFFKAHHTMALAWDRIHPNQTGHMILARAFLKTVEFQY